MAFIHFPKYTLRMWIIHILAGPYVCIYLANTLHMYTNTIKLMLLQHASKHSNFHTQYTAHIDVYKRLKVECSYLYIMCVNSMHIRKEPFTHII